VLRLVTIPISHYCEKARWALDRAGIPYREERHVQGVHRIASRRAGGRGTLPVLVTPQGPIVDSAAIVEWTDRRLEPERRLLPQDSSERTRVRTLCRRLDEGLGPAGRRLIYIHALQLPPRRLQFNNVGVPRWEALALRGGWPLAKHFIGEVLAIRPGVEIEDERVVWSELDHIAAMLADGRPYLLGDRFGAADLTFAALSAAVVLPERYGSPLPRPEEISPATTELVRRVREHPAGEYALWLFAHERPSPAPVS
jgi:glutathione S-transferase